MIKIRISKTPIQQTQPKNNQNIEQKFSKDKAEKFSNLPRKTPPTNIRRLSNKVVYEITLPGVKSINDISIVRVEKGIEIKAVAKDKGYLKAIPINLPLTGKDFRKEKLVLELDAD